MWPALQLVLLAAAPDGGTETLAQAVERQVRGSLDPEPAKWCTSIVSDEPVAGTGLRLIVFSDACTGASDSCADQGVLTSAAFVGPDRQLQARELLTSGGMGVETRYTAGPRGFEVEGVYTTTYDLGGPVVSVSRQRHTVVPTPRGTFERGHESEDLEYPFFGRYVDEATQEALHLDATATGHAEGGQGAQQSVSFSRVAIGYTSPKRPAKRALEVVSSSFARREFVVRFSPKGAQYQLTVSDDRGTVTSHRLGSDEVQHFTLAQP